MSGPLPPGRGIALALGGGAALGWAHIGVLRVLEEEGIAVGAVAGTSIGALAAVCLAADRLDALEAIARAATRRRVLAYLDPHLRRGALLGGRRIARELAEHLGPRTFEALRIPACAVAADLDTGAEVRLASGPLVDAVAASMALPALFRPVRRDGRTLIDGGMVANLPIAAARALAPGLPVVAIDLMGDFAGHVRAGGWDRRPRSAFAVARSAFLMTMARQGQLTAALERPEALVALPLGHRSTGDFHRAEELIGIGREATRAALPRLRALLPA